MADFSVLRYVISSVFAIQSYNCLLERDLDMQEQFVRQSQTALNKPVIVISSSGTPNWKAEDCTSQIDLHSLSTADMAVLRKINNSSDSYMRIITGNEAIIQSWGRGILRLLAQYSNIAIEVFRHDQ